MSRAAVVDVVPVGTAMAATSAGPSKVAPGARAEVLAIVEQACGPGGCDTVRIVVAGEELARVTASDASQTAERLVRLVEEDATTREPSRHSYAISALRDDREVFRSVIRVMGGGQSGSPGVFSADPTAAGALKLVLRHLEATGGLLVRSQGVTLDSMARELERTRARLETLEDQNDALRAQLQRAIEGGRVDEARAEQERRRTELIVHAGRQLLRYLPHILSTWFPMPEDESEKGKPAKLAPPAVAAALGGVTDDQLAAARDVLTVEQLAIVERARAGGAITVPDVVRLADISEEAAMRLSTVLRPDQFAALVDAFSVVTVPPSKG